jgi:hypothetical protein
MAMRDSRLHHAFLLFHVTLGLVVLIASLETAFRAVSPHSGAANPHLALLAGIEAAGAVLFLWPRTLRIGGILMLLTFAVAVIVHGLRGEFGGFLLVYGAGTLFVMAHGPVSLRSGRPEPATGT